MKLHRFILTALLALGFASPSQAAITTLFDNLSRNVDASSLFNDVNTRYASDFFTDGNPNTITSITAFMGSTANNDLTVTFSIFTDNGSGKPGTLVKLFDTSPTIPGNTANNFFTATSSGINLDASTLYWVVGQVNEQGILGDVSWRNSTSDAIDGGSFSTESGTSIQFSSNGGGSYVNSTTGNLLFRLQGDITPIPEPTGLALLITAGAFGTSTVIGWWRRRRVALSSLPDRGPAS